MKKLLFSILIVFSLAGISQNHIKTLTGFNQWPVSAAFSNDGKSIYVGSHDRMIWIFDVQTGKLTDTLKFHSGSITTLDMSTQGILASGGWDKNIGLWNAGSVSPFLLLNGHAEKINQIRFSPDGRQLAGVDDEGKLLIWDVITGGIVKQIQAHALPATSLCFRSDGRLIATTSWDKSVKLWNVVTGELVVELKSHRNSTTNVRFSTNNKFIVSTAIDNSMIVWDAQTYEVFRKFEFYKQAVADAMFLNNDNQLLSIDHQGELKVYNFNTLQLLFVKQAHEGKINAMAWSGIGSLLATVGEDKRVNIWDLSEYAYLECLRKKAPELEIMKRPKGEFETTVQYEKRLADYEKRKVSLVEECKKDALLEQQALERMRLDKEAQAYSWVNLKLTDIGTYNADKQEYPVMLDNQIFIVSMNIEDAKVFKENWQKANIKAVKKDLGSDTQVYLNIELEHPVTKAKYLLGEHMTASSDPAFKIFLEKQRR